MHYSLPRRQLCGKVLMRKKHHCCKGKLRGPFSGVISLRKTALKSDRKTLHKAPGAWLLPLSRTTPTYSPCEAHVLTQLPASSSAAALRHTGLSLLSVTSPKK